MLQVDVLTLGEKSDQCRALAAAMNRRLETRSLKERQVRVADEPMTLDRELLEAVVTCAWALGASRSTLTAMQRDERVPIGVVRMIRNPGLRTSKQKELGSGAWRTCASSASSARRRRSSSPRRSSV